MKANVKTMSRKGNKREKRDTRRGKWDAERRGEDKDLRRFLLACDRSENACSISKYMEARMPTIPMVLLASMNHERRR